MHTHHPGWARPGVASLLAMILTACATPTATILFEKQLDHDGRHISLKGPSNHDSSACQSVTFYPQ